MKVYLLYFCGDDYYDQPEIKLASLSLDVLEEQKAILEAPALLGNAVEKAIGDWWRANHKTQGDVTNPADYEQRNKTMTTDIVAQLNLDPSKSLREYSKQAGTWSIEEMDLV